MILLDVNILVYAHREDAPSHAAFLRWLEAALDGAEPVGVSDLVLAGFLRIVTHPRVFAPPTPLADALTFAHQVRDHHGVRTVRPGPDHWRLFVTLCREGNAKGNLVPDAYHAAGFPARVGYARAWGRGDRCGSESQARCAAGARRRARDGAERLGRPAPPSRGRGRRGVACGPARRRSAAGPGGARPVGVILDTSIWVASTGG